MPKWVVPFQKSSVFAVTRRSRLNFADREIRPSVFSVPFEKRKNWAISQPQTELDSLSFADLDMIEANFSDPPLGSSLSKVDFIQAGGQAMCVTSAPVCSRPNTLDTE
jgi:hypothetical protein